MSAAAGVDLSAACCRCAVLSPAGLFLWLATRTGAFNTQFQLFVTIGILLAQLVRMRALVSNSCSILSMPLVRAGELRKSAL